MLTLSYLDEATTGAIVCESTTLTVRDIIRMRVQQEVERFNRSEAQVFRGLIQPGETERLLNGVRPSHRALDWEEQFAHAIRAFEGNGFLVLVDDRQITELDESLDLNEHSQVKFVRLVPLIGG